MDDFSQILINGGLAMFILEIIKWVYRISFNKQGFDFPPVFYGVAIPTLNILVIPLLAFLGVEGISMPTDWLSWIQSAIVVAVGSAVSLLFYSGGLEKLKKYNREYRLNKEAERDREDAVG